LDRRRGCEGGVTKGGVTGRNRRCSRPMTELHRRLRTINIAGSGAPKTAGGGYVGARPGKCSGHPPPDDGPGNHRLPPRRTPLDNRSTLWGDGRVKRRAAAGSPAPWRTCQNTDVQPDGGTRSPTGMPGMGDHRPAVGHGQMMAVGTFDVCSNAAVNSDLSSFLCTL